MQANVTLPSYKVPAHLKKYFRPHLCGGCYVCHITAVFREVKRVLRDDGVVWLNLGDSYTAQRGQRKTTDRAGAKQQTKRGSTGCPSQYIPNLAPKQLVGIPWRVAFALQADGWWLRSDVIWHKPNCMPESVTDRPTKAHEYLFLLTKSARYYYDAEAVKERASEDSGWAKQRAKGVNTWKYNDTPERIKSTGQSIESSTLGQAGTRNRRSVWTIPTQSYKGAHFATFPEKLVEPCILAGTSARGECPICGLGWVRVVEKGNASHDAPTDTAYEKGSAANRLARLRQAARARGEEYQNTTTTTGWRPQCNHYPRADEWQEFPRKDADESDEDYTARMQPIDEKRQELLELWRPLKTIPQTVLDPFAGTATVGRVATQHRRRFVGLELNPEYIGLAGERTRNVAVKLPL